MKKIFVLLLVLLLLFGVVGAVIFYFQGLKTIASSFSQLAQKKSEENSKMADFIQVISPRQNEIISNPLIVSGKARGSWYFEAVFPVRLLDEKGNELEKTSAQALSEWTTEDFVPFRAQLRFEVPTANTGTLVLQNDNPSGLPANAKEIRIPVRFK